MTFIVDPGAFNNLVNEDELFSNYIELQPSIKVSVAKNETFIITTRKGTIHLISDKDVKGVLKDVLHSQEVPHHLLSVREMQQEEMTITFNQKGVEMRKGIKIIIIGKSLKNLTVVNFQIMTNNFNCNV